MWNFVKCLSTSIGFFSFFCFVLFLFFPLYFILFLFSTSIVMMVWFLSFILLMCCITLIYLQMLNHPCIPGINPSWSWCTFLNVLLNLVCNICWRFFHLCSSGILACNFLFFFFLSFLFLFSFFLPHPWHVELPRPVIESAPQQWKYWILTLLSQQGIL